MTATQTPTATFESLNPRTGDVVGTHPVNTAEEVQAVVGRGPGRGGVVGRARPSTSASSTCRPGRAR